MKNNVKYKLDMAEAKLKKCRKKLKSCNFKTFTGRHDARSMRSHIAFYEIRIGQMQRELRV